MKSIWAAGINDVWAAGFHAAGGAIHRWDGTHWKTVYEREYIAFSKVWGSASDDVWIAGAAGTAIHWNGTRFSDVSHGHDSIGQLWSSARNDVWMTGPPNNLLHFQGARWEQVTLPNAPSESNAPCDVTALWGTHARDVWAAGRRGAVLHFDGTMWKRAQSGATEDLFTLWGTASNNVWAAGDLGTLAHWDGERWSLSPFPPAWRIVQIWGLSSQSVWAATDGQAFHWDGGEWSMVEGVEASAFGGTDASDVWVAQKRGFLRLVECDGANKVDDPKRQPFILTRTPPERRVPDTSGETPPTETEARAFVRHLVEAASANDVARWKSMLSWKCRAKCNPTLQLSVWARALIARSTTLDHAVFSTAHRGGRTTIHFQNDGKNELTLSVTREDGELRLDEN